MSRVVNRIKLLGDARLSEYLTCIDNIISVDILYNQDKYVRDVISSERLEEDKCYLLSKHINYSFDTIIREMYRQSDNIVWIILYG